MDQLILGLLSIEISSITKVGFIEEKVMRLWEVMQSKLLVGDKKKVLSIG